MNLPSSLSPVLAPLTEASIASLAQEQQERMRELESLVGKKFYFLLEERLERQKAELEELLAWQKGETKKAAQYSFFLDTAFFEQKFL